MKKLILSCLILSACSHQPSVRQPASSHTSWKSFLEQKINPLPEFFAEDGSYLEQPWKKSSEVAFEGTPPVPSQLTEVPFACNDKKLWPTHPQQYSKEYVYAIQTDFDRLRLPPLMNSCIIPNPTKKYCLRAQTANVMVMSDIFEDSCGNKYRAYWVVTFRTGGGPSRSEDNMGTLLSKGRTQYEKPHAQFKGEYVTGYTYPVNPNDFIFLGKIYPGDLAKMKAAQAEALRQGFTLKGKSFQPK
jgi:hypothetical protein